MTSPATQDRTEVGNYFVSNYPPYSFWSPERVGEIERALEEPPGEVPLGLYLHIPFCRKRCKFCYFRVYIDKNAREVERYLEALASEVALYRDLPAVQGRSLRFVYFGGGTPSFISPKQLHALVARLKESVSWDGAEEVTFECEPGTLNEKKLEAIREIGVTRLSIGIENFDDAILEENGRAHRSPEIFRSYELASRLDFDQINVDLIAGMVGETPENWKRCVRRTIELAPDSVTIYQMELPFNTIYSRETKEGDGRSPVAGWALKREWVDYAFDELLAAGYHASSAYTLVRDPDAKFVYRDGLWQGADLLGTGVASFGHVSGVHYQNADGFERYCETVEEGRLPLHRALRVTDHQRMIRELILQLKTGRVTAGYFREKFGADVLDEFRDVLEGYEQEGLLRLSSDEIRLTRKGLLRADSLLEAFFEPEHRNARTT